MIRFLSAEDVRQALPMADAIEAMKTAFSALSAGEVEMPLRGRVQSAEGVTLLMPAHLHHGAMGVKIVSVFGNNPAKGLPIIHAMVLVIHPHTGQIMAMMEGASVTAIRTGAGSGAATDALARLDARNVAIIGSGVQARTQLEAVCTVRSIEHVTVYSRTQANAQKFASEMARKGAIPKHIQVADTAESAIADADIICVATTSTTPVFDGRALKAGVHINGVGSYTPQMVELDALTLQKSLITVDSRESVLAEAGEIISAIANGDITEASIHAEIGEIIAGTKTGRTDESQITYFKSCGVAVQDAIAGQLALANAEKMNLGTLLHL